MGVIIVFFLKESHWLAFHQKISNYGQSPIQAPLCPPTPLKWSLMASFWPLLGSYIDASWSVPKQYEVNKGVWGRQGLNWKRGRKQDLLPIQSPTIHFSKVIIWSDYFCQSIIIHLIDLSNNEVVGYFILFPKNLKLIKPKLPFPKRRKL
jgi:hypothetical protein